MEIIIEQKGVFEKIVGDFKLHGTKADLLLVYGSMKEQLTAIDKFKSDEIGTININVKPAQIGVIKPFGG